MPKKQKSMAVALKAPLSSGRSLWEQQREKLPLLFSHYNLDAQVPYAAVNLVLAMAADLFPGFRLPKKKGASKKSGAINDAAALEILSRTAKGKSASSAAASLARLKLVSDEKGKPLTKGAIRRRADRSFIAHFIDLKPIKARRGGKIPADIGLVLTSRILDQLYELTREHPGLSVIVDSAKSDFGRLLCLRLNQANLFISSLGVTDDGSDVLIAEGRGGGNICKPIADFLIQLGLRVKTLRINLSQEVPTPALIVLAARVPAALLETISNRETDGGQGLIAPHMHEILRPLRNNP